MNNAEQIVTRVTGFIEPIFIGKTPDGKTLNGVGPTDWEKIRAGYACEECLATFDTYTIVCPVCRHVRDVLTDIPAPQHWLDHLAERENPGVKYQPQSFDEAMGKMSGQMEQIPLKKLRKRKR